MDLPYLTSDTRPILGTIRQDPEDFQVDEIPAYPPTGEGEHLLVHFTKRSLTTPEAVSRIARALGVGSRSASWAGLKDRHAVTTQWACFHQGDAAKLDGASIEGVEVLSASRHVNKLRTGHLHGNRFAIRVRSVPEDRISDLERAVERVRASGVPNYFGGQRFGVDAGNLAAARRWIVEGGKPPQRPFERKLLCSVMQSAMFNALLATRVRSGEVARPI